MINSKIYIGCHKTLDLDDDYMGSGKHLKRAINKYGVENFEKEYLYIFDNSEDMFEAEATLVNEEFVTDKDTYNIMQGGYGSFDYINENGLNGSVKGVEACSKKRKAGDNWAPFLGKQHTIEAKEKMSNTKIGTGIGKQNSQFGTMWITNEIENKKIKKTDSIPEGFRKGRKLKIP